MPYERTRSDWPSAPEKADGADRAATGPVAFIETRKRGAVGKLFLIAFVIWQAIMAAWLFSYLVELGKGVAAYESEAARQGFMAGGVIGTAVLFVIWTGGTVILGGIVLLTRGQKILTRMEPSTR